MKITIETNINLTREFEDEVFQLKISEEGKFIIESKGKTKSDAVHDCIKYIDNLIKDLKDAKKEIQNI